MINRVIDINTKSWHFKLFKWSFWNSNKAISYATGRKETNRCIYLKRVGILFPLKMIIILTLFGLALALLGILGFYIWKTPWDFLIAVSIIIGMAITSLVIAIVIVYSQEYFPYHKRKFYTVISRTGFYQYLNDKKDGICPVVRFIPEDNYNSENPLRSQ